MATALSVGMETRTNCTVTASEGKADSSKSVVLSVPSGGVSLYTSRVNSPRM